MSIAAFLVSWSLNAIVSIMTTIRGSKVLTHDLTEGPDLLAKAWVIYNPNVCSEMNDRFRKTPMRIVPIRCIMHRSPNKLGKLTSLTVESRLKHAYTVPDLSRKKPNVWCVQEVTSVIMNTHKKLPSTNGGQFLFEIGVEVVVDSALDFSLFIRNCIANMCTFPHLN